MLNIERPIAHQSSITFFWYTLYIIGAIMQRAKKTVQIAAVVAHSLGLGSLVRQNRSFSQIAASRI